MTRFNRLHPYPAMVADQLAIELCEKYIEPGSRVIDPFCGTGRTLLAASERAAYCVGVDVNPLASIIVNAKAAWHDHRIISELISEIDDHASSVIYDDFYCEIEEGRKVEWFPPLVRSELQSIVGWLNKKNLSKSTLFLVASILSATIRDVSFCRKGQWKLHRMSELERNHFTVSAWLVLRRRLQSILDELHNLRPLGGSCYAVVGDARNLTRLLEKCKEHKFFDVVITSPPYGDSFTTVQYGGMSGLSLGVLRYLKNLGIEIYKGGDIDNYCLGGGCSSAFQASLKDQVFLNPHDYWHGSKANAAYRKVSVFLQDLELSCKQICSILKRHGRAIFIVARRSTGGWRLYLDKFMIDVMNKYGLSLEQVSKRKIKNKVIPYIINRNGHKKIENQSKNNNTPTMKEEYVLIFVKL